MDPVQNYQVLAGFAKDFWGRRLSKDKPTFCFDMTSKEAKEVQKTLQEHAFHKPYAVSGCIKMDYFNNWFNPKRIGEWIKLLGESVHEESLKVALKSKCIPVDELVKIASPAVFGKGSETVYDASVRKAWDIPADRLRKGNSHLFLFNTPVHKNIRIRIEKAMKPKGARWSYKLYKMHLYGPGDKFLPHVDTLHASNHVATVVVGLPIEHSGGSLVVKHMDKAVKFDLSNDNVNRAKYCAFFTDCAHEVEEVTSGWRIVLQYDVYQEKSRGDVKQNSHKNDADKEDDNQDQENAKEDDKKQNDYNDQEKTGDKIKNDDKKEEDDEDEDQDNVSEDENKEDNYDEEDSYDEDGKTKLDVILDNWREGTGSTPKLDKIAVAVPHKNLEDAMIRFLGKKNPNDRIAILFHHHYSLHALQDCILKGTDYAIYDAFDSERWTRTLQGVVINAEQEYDQEHWEILKITPISLEDFVQGNDDESCNITDDEDDDNNECSDAKSDAKEEDENKDADDAKDADDDKDDDAKDADDDKDDDDGKDTDDDKDSADDKDSDDEKDCIGADEAVNDKDVNEHHCSGKTYVLCYGDNPPCGSVLAHTYGIEYTGNEAQNGSASYFMTCVILDYDGSGPVAKKMKLDK
jgi:2OG-Fe(II) oxygenase superfamily